MMEMQDVDFELVFTNQKGWSRFPRLYLSRHPLLETDDGNTKKIFGWTMSAEHAVVITRTREEIWKDEVMQQLADLEPKRIMKEY